MKCQHQQINKIADFGENQLYLCTACQIVIAKFTQNNPSAEQKYQEYYAENTSSRFGFGLETIIKLFRWNRAYYLHKIHPQAKSALDIGCGRGLILYYLKKYFAFTTVLGTQISKPAAEFARNKLKLTIYEQDLLTIDFAEQKFDIISLLHVLEHVDQPEAYLEKIYQLLNPGGILMLEVPNFQAWTKNFTSQYWLSLDPPYHLYFFTPDTLTRLLKKYNFTIKHINTFSFEYSIFTSATSLVSKLTKTNNLVYKFLQTKKLSWQLIPLLFLFILILPISLIINLLLYKSRKGEVIRIIASK